MRLVGEARAARAARSVRYWMRLGTVAAVTGVFCVLLVFPALLAHRLLHPQRLAPATTPAARQLEYEEVTFAGQGVQLHGWYLPARGEAAVVLVHGFPGERSALLGLVPALHAAGYHLLLYDQRASGASDGDMVTFGYYESGDLAAATDFLRARAGAQQVGVFGASFGASVALLAAGQGARIDAVVADSPFADLEELVAEGTPARLFGPAMGALSAVLSPLMLRQAEWQSGLRAASVRPVGVVAQISPRPLLLVHGLADRLYGYHNSVALYEAAREPKELWLVPDTPHAGARSRDRGEYDRRLVGFFQRAFATGQLDKFAASAPNSP